MRSRRVNQVAIVALLLVVVGLVFALRIILLGVFDNNIENEEATIRATQVSINEDARLVDLHGQQTLPSMVEMHRYVPSQFVRAQLETFVQSQLEISGISNVSDRNRRVSITESVAGNIDAELTGVDVYRVHISYRAYNEQEIFDFIDRMTALEQFFILQTISYNIPTEDTSSLVSISYLTFYKQQISE